MKTILVANPKGGAGKSTLAVHIATWFARRDEIVYLGDLDRQQSSHTWLSLRAPNLPVIQAWKTSEEDFRSPPKGCEVAVLDTPAGLHGKRLKELLSEVDIVVVPVSPSRFDMQASQDFFAELADIKAVRKEKVKVGMVGMRVNPKTHASQQLINFLQQFDLPLVACIPQGQRYVNAAEQSQTIFDAASISQSDMADWRPLLEWL